MVPSPGRQAIKPSELGNAFIKFVLVAENSHVNLQLGFEFVSVNSCWSRLMAQKTAKSMTNLFTLLS